ncbi:FliM/FliN family flagellar motor switch protein [Vibrio sp. ZSDE26]|uniref:FliM/FliN family flagellar motor switch protein n=1 Tax=Vibrio amylolyticus TaxID=2847292 RepID=A0A9X1XI04_9VIBR|nr:FliM/FliN family flagellar motor switch protein [Vibrio amylolyticus]MCK6263372.1 FliM/FliN family flagellar motor switch protein [Vibrio amylolyticus]
MKNNIKTDNNKLKKESDNIVVHNIDTRTLGRPLNMARQNLIPLLNKSEEQLKLVINSMTRRNDTEVKISEVSIEMQPIAPLHHEPIYFSHNRNHGMSMVVVSGDLITQIADAFYGGAPSFESNDTHSHPPLNSSEKRVQARLGATVLNQLSSEWQTVSTHEPLDSTTLHVLFTITIGDRVGQLSLQLDDHLLIHLGQPTAPIIRDVQEVEDRRNKHLQQVPVQLNAVLASQRISLNQVSKLKVGDIISADIKELVEVSSGAQKLFRARVSEQNNHLVLQITDHINPSENFQK